MLNIPRMCRFCLLEECVENNIYLKDIFKEQSEILSDKINKCLGVCVSNITS